MNKASRLRGPKGRFVPVAKPAAEAQGASAARGGALDPASGTLQPSQCAVYLRRKLASSFPAIVQGFVKQAESGSVQHLKLTTELLEKPATAKKRKGSAQRMWETLGRMEQEKTSEGDELAPADGGWRE